VKCFYTVVITLEAPSISLEGFDIKSDAARGWRLKQSLDLETKARGYDLEFDHLLLVLFDNVLPRLLRPLESEGRSVILSFFQGNLWFSNCGRRKVYR